VRIAAFARPLLTGSQATSLPFAASVATSLFPDRTNARQDDTARAYEAASLLVDCSQVRTSLAVAPGMASSRFKARALAGAPLPFGSGLHVVQ